MEHMTSTHLLHSLRSRVGVELRLFEISFADFGLRVVSWVLPQPTNSLY